jgi:hypothetical protein
LANAIAGIDELAAEGLRQCGKLLKARPALAVEAID